jgi:Spy/CpxP family protein refolding chaperone
MKAKSILSLAMILTSAVGLGACNHNHHHNAKHQVTRSFNHLAGMLDLSPDQRLEFAAIQAEAVALQQEGEALKEAWYGHALKQFRAETIDRGEAERFHSEQSVRIEELGRRFSSALIQLKTVLTPAQQKTLLTELEKHARSQHH